MLKYINPYKCFNRFSYMKLGDKIIFPKVSDFEAAQDYFDHINDSKEACEKRGHHLINSDNKDPLICYECDLYFSKQETEVGEIKYKVVPL